MSPNPNASGRDMYRQVKERAAKGDFTLVEPMDYLILGILHDEGEMFAGAYPLATSAKQISREAFEGKIPASILGPRFNSLKAQGLVITVLVPGNLGKHAYQRTALGKKIYDEWSRNNGTPNRATDEV